MAKKVIHLHKLKKRKNVVKRLKTITNNQQILKQLKEKYNLKH